MRCVAASLLALVVVTLAGCDSRTPVSPTLPPGSNVAASPPPTAPAPGQPVWNWNLTTVLTDVIGPDNCFTRQQSRAGLPRSESWQMEVTRTGDVVAFDYDVRNYPSDNVRHTGTAEGNQFTARSVSWPTRFPTCSDGTPLTGTFDAKVTGRFSDDGAHLTAKEVWTYHFSSGDVTFLIDWSADQR